MCLQLSLVGMVVSVTENKTNLSYEIDDFSGKILNVKRWIDQDVRNYSKIFLWNGYEQNLAKNCSFYDATTINIHREISA